jgi:hypothetical protein
MQTVIKVPVTLRCGSSFVKKDIHGEEAEEEEEEEEEENKSQFRSPGLETYYQ